jgi:transposase-like protein
MLDPFERLRSLSKSRHELTHEWLSEIKALRALGFSVRAIAQAAGVSHNTVFRRSS